MRLKSQILWAGILTLFTIGFVIYSIFIVYFAFLECETDSLVFLILTMLLLNGGGTAMSLVALVKLYREIYAKIKIKIEFLIQIDKNGFEKEKS